MKINKKRNQWMIGIVIVNVLLTIMLFIINFNRISINWFLYYPLHAITEITYILIIVYLIGTLQAANESIAIQTPFNIFWGVEIIGAISSFLSIRQQNLIMIISVIGVLNIIMTLYILIITFKIKNKNLSSAFKSFGITQVLAMLIKIAVPFVWVITTSRPTPISKYLSLVGLLPIFTVFYIISKMQEYLRHTYDEHHNNLEAQNL